MTRWQPIRYASTIHTTPLRRKARASAIVNHLHLRTLGLDLRSFDFKRFPKDVNNPIGQVPYE